MVSCHTGADAGAEVGIAGGLLPAGCKATAPAVGAFAFVASWLRGESKNDIRPAPVLLVGRAGGLDSGLFHGLLDTNRH